ncbi:MAG: ribosomal-processing cysteine protease Prp [Bacilli bacterium]
MINIEIIRRDGSIIYLKSSGHADYDELGKDIVCAGVSAVIFAGLNSFESINDFEINIVDNSSVEIKTKNKITSHDVTVLEVVYNGLKSIEESYSKYVKIKTKE